MNALGVLTAVFVELLEPEMMSSLFWPLQKTCSTQNSASCTLVDDFRCAALTQSYSRTKLDVIHKYENIWRKYSNTVLLCMHIII